MQIYDFFKSKHICRCQFPDHSSHERRLCFFLVQLLTHGQMNYILNDVMQLKLHLSFHQEVNALRRIAYLVYLFTCGNYQLDSRLTYSDLLYQIPVLGECRSPYHLLILVQHLRFVIFESRLVVLAI